MQNVTVLGAGSWGTALAVVLAENGHNTLLWTHREEQAQEINSEHKNAKYLPKTVLPESLRATSDLELAAKLDARREATKAQVLESTGDLT